MTLSGLQCLRCGQKYSPVLDAGLCPTCGPGDGTADPGVLEVQYDYRQVTDVVDHSSAGIFRYRSLLPVSQAGPILPTGDTPLIPAPRLARRLGLARLYLKDERRSATQCLKDRATAIGITLAAGQKRRDLYCASAGNAAISLAGYCAHAGFSAHVFVPFDASPVRLGWLKRFGAEVIVSSGNYDQAFAESEAVGAAAGWYNRNCAFNPYLVEGKKTVAFEIAEQLAWTPPDWVVAPVGDGCTLGAIGKGFRELVAVGRTETAPHLLGVQAEGMQPMVRRFSGASGEESGDTAAASIKVRYPRNALRLLKELKAAGGMMLGVGERAISEAQRTLAEDCGVLAEFTSATTIAGLERLATYESLTGKTAVAVITGGRVD